MSRTRNTPLAWTTNQKVEGSAFLLDKRVQSVSKKESSFLSYHVGIWHFSMLMLLLLRQSEHGP